MNRRQKIRFFLSPVAFAFPLPIFVPLYMPLEQDGQLELWHGDARIMWQHHLWI